MSQFARYPVVSVSSTSPSTGTNGTTAPTSTTQVGGPNNTGVLTPVKLTAAQNLLVDGSTVTQPISAAALPLPAGASTSALQTSGNASLTSLDSKTPALGQALAAASVPVVLTAAQLSTLTPLTTVAITAAALPLPAGAATSALQTTGNTSLATLATNSPALVGGAVPVVGTATTAVFQAEGSIAFGTLISTYATVITTATAWKQFSFRNSCNTLVQLSLDGGTTTHFTLEQGDAISIDLRADNIQVAAGTVIQARWSGASATSGTIRVNGVS